MASAMRVRGPWPLAVGSALVLLAASSAAQLECGCSAKQQLDCRNRSLSSLWLALLDAPECSDGQVIDIRDNALTLLDFPSSVFERFADASIYADNNLLTALTPIDGWTGTRLDVACNRLRRVEPLALGGRLDVLHIRGNVLQLLDLSHAQRLEELFASDNLIENLVPPPANECSLTYINLNNNNLISLDPLTNSCNKLKEVFVSNNSITTLDLATHSKLETLTADGNSLSRALAPFPNCALKYLNLASNSLTSADNFFGNCHALKEVIISSNLMSSLNLIHNNRLDSFIASFNAIDTMTPPSQNCSLEYLNISNNQLSTLDSFFQQCSKLKEVFCPNNFIASMNLSGASHLQTLSVSNNLLSAMLLPSGACSLKSLDVSGNNLTDFPSLSACSDLRAVDVRNNSLSRFPKALFQLVRLRNRSRSDSDAAEITVDLRRNPISNSEVLGDIVNYNDGNSPVTIGLADEDPNCAILKTKDKQYAPIKYCLSNMYLPERSISLWTP